MKPTFTPYIWRVLISLMAASFCGCKTQENSWHELERAARPTVNDLQQTRFALIGRIVTAEGTFFVADQDLIIKGMLSPHGQAKLLLFDTQNHLVKSYSIRTAYPLWCEGSRVYLGGLGDFWDIPLDPRIIAMSSTNEPSIGGNVVDFSRGITRPFLTREKKYGSSGGIEDDPWRYEQAYR